jgi:hypothetical protein
MIGLVDERLDKSLAYYSHALLLVRVLDSSPSLRGNHRFLLCADILLHAHKAMSAIVGDPSTDKDYQSRYKAIGVKAETWSRIEGIRQEVRNALDVAHYRPDWEAMKQLPNHVKPAEAVASDVIGEYMDWLLGGLQANPGL